MQPDKSTATKRNGSMPVFFRSSAFCSTSCSQPFFCSQPLEFELSGPGWAANGSHYHTSRRTPRQERGHDPTVYPGWQAPSASPSRRLSHRHPKPAVLSVVSRLGASIAAIRDRWLIFPFCSIVPHCSGTSCSLSSLCSFPHQTSTVSMSLHHFRRR